jgi:hypothetical protein
VLQFLAADEQVGIGVGPVIGDPEADKLIGIIFVRVDFGQETLRTRQLLQPPGRRGEPHLLIRQLLQGVKLESAHNHQLLSDRKHVWCRAAAYDRRLAKARGSAEFPPSPTIPLMLLSPVAVVRRTNSLSFFTPDLLRLAKKSLKFLEKAADD